MDNSSKDIKKKICQTKNVNDLVDMVEVLQDNEEKMMWTRENMFD